MENSNWTAIQDLKTEIKRLTFEGREFAQAITKLGKDPGTGPERHSLWCQKQALGRTTRTALLAYGLLRGIPYKAMEPKCRAGNEPRALLIREKIESLLGPDNGWTQARVVAYIFVGTDPVREEAA